MYFAVRVLVALLTFAQVVSAVPALAQSSSVNTSQTAPVSQSEDPSVVENNEGEDGTENLAEEFNLPPRLLDPHIDTELLELLLLPLNEGELASASAAWQRIVQQQVQKVVDQTVRVRETEGETADLFRNRVTELTEDRRHMFNNFVVVLNSWQKKGGSEDEIAKYRAYRNEVPLDL